MPTRVISLKIDEELLEEIDSAARELGLSRSELIRRILKDYVEQRKKRPTPFRVVRLYA